MAASVPLTVTVTLDDETKSLLKAIKEQKLDPKRVETVLRAVIGDLDYDLHKQVECDEETGENKYPEIAEDFIILYEETGPITAEPITAPTYRKLSDNPQA